MSKKTLKQIADELGIKKQRVYRFVKKYHINEAHQFASGNQVDLQIIQKNSFGFLVFSDRPLKSW